MSTKKSWLGKVLKDVNGYKIRQMGTSKSFSSNGLEKSFFQHNGTYGVYAGRKKLKKDGFKSIDGAVEFANTL